MCVSNVYVITVFYDVASCSCEIDVDVSDELTASTFTADECPSTLLCFPK